MRPVTHLQLLHGGLIVTGLIAIHAWLDEGGPRVAWALAFLFCFAMISWYAMLLFMPKARSADSRWQKPISETASQRIMSAAWGTLFVLMTLVFIACELVAFGESPWLGGAGVIVFVVAQAIAHRYVRRGAGHPLMPYAIAATIVATVPSVMLALGRLPVT